MSGPFFFFWIPVITVCHETYQQRSRCRRPFATVHRSDSQSSSVSTSWRFADGFQVAHKAVNRPDAADQKALQ